MNTIDRLKENTASIISHNQTGVASQSASDLFHKEATAHSGILVQKGILNPEEISTLKPSVLVLHPINVNKF